MEDLRFRTRGGYHFDGALSPVLWALLIDILLIMFFFYNNELSAYDDYLVKVIKGKFEEVISQLLQAILRTICRWCKKIGMSINLSKLITVSFIR